MGFQLNLMNHCSCIMRRSKVLAFFFLLDCANVFAFDLLTEDIVVDSAINYYPKIYIAEEKVHASEAKLREARGEFDTSLNVKNRQFTSGYYDGNGYLESRITKPLPFMNAKIYGGYMRSYNGDYPEVVPYYSTRSDGRAMFGVEFSLLRGFLINEKNVIRDIAKLD